MRNEEKTPHQQPIEERLRRIHERAEDRPQTYVTAPRANPPSDEYDVARGEEKLERVVGN